MVSFERTISVVEISLEDSTSNEGTSFVRGCKEEASSSEIFERKRENNASIINNNQPQLEPLKNLLPTKTMKYV